MVRWIKHIITVCIVLNAMNAAAQTISNRGKEFWAGFGHHVDMETENPLEIPDMVLYFSADAQQATVTVNVDGTGWTKVYHVPAYGVISSDVMPAGLKGSKPDTVDTRLYSRDISYGGTNSQGLFQKKAIHITSDVPVVAYAHIYAGASSAATMLLPVDSWGYSYTALTASQTENAFANDRFSWLFIVAKEDGTRVKIIPSVKLRNQSPPNVPIIVTLQKGEIYQIMGGYDDTAHIYDLSGTTVVSVANDQGVCKPSAVFLGSSGLYVSCGSTTQKFPTEENIMQQSFPEQAWGKRYITIPSSVDQEPTKHNPNLFRILVKNRATIVKRNGVQLSGISDQNYYDFWSSTADYVEADQPVQVAQIMPSQGSCNYTGEGDPEMTYISPVEQGIKSAGFYRNNKVSIDWNFLALAIPTAGLNSLTIDGARDFTYTYPHPYLAGYSVVVHRWRTTAPPRAPVQAIVKSDSAFTAITYGLGQAETYAYNAGTYINNLNGIAYMKNGYNTADTANLFTCVRTPVHLSVLMRYKPDKLTWKLSELAGVLTPATDITDNAPVVKEEVKVNGVNYYRYELAGAYTFTRAGTYIVPLYSTESSVPNCDNTEKIQYEVSVHGASLAGFSIVFDNCKASEIIKFNGDSTFTNGGTVRSWSWTFTGNGVNSTGGGQYVQQLFNAGDYLVKMTAVDSNACGLDTTKGFRLSASPAIPDFTVTVGTNCEGTAAHFAETFQADGAASWYWQFDGKDTLLTENGFVIDKVTDHYDTIMVKHVIKYSAACESDTARQTVIIYARPDITFSAPSGCVPGNGLVAFRGTSTIADAQGPSSYVWNFGDTLATAANPNTSVLQNPSHTYSSGGTYHIDLKVTSEKGCVADTLVPLNLYLYPVISFNNATDVCQGVAPVSVASALITNNVLGAGIYKGENVTPAGMLSVAAQGTVRVWYVFTTQEGCVDSAYADLTIKPAPAAVFSVTPSQMCSGGDVVIADASTIPSGRVRTWKWSFGDGQTAQYTTGDPFSRTYNTAGSYNIKLVTVAASGCMDSVTHTLDIGAVPEVSFSLPAAVCMPGETVFVNTTTISGGAALTYLWNYGDGTTGTTNKHTYAAAGSYLVKLVATSAGVCKDSAQQTMSAFYNKPIVIFTVTPEICQGQEVIIKNNTIVTAQGNVTKWDWNFGDGTTSVSRTPDKTYDSAGVFIISVQGTSRQGCVSDSSKQTVKVYPQPVVDAGPDIAAEEGSIVTLQATAAGGSLLYLWSPAQPLSNATVLQPTLLVTDDMVFTITATGEFNCTASDNMQIKVQRPLVIPNIFTPNGDGVHDTWVIKNIELYPRAAVQVVNRYGQKVYEAAGLIKPWDGTVNGSPVPAGTYYYIIRLNNGDGPLTGSVTLIR